MRPILRRAAAAGAALLLAACTLDGLVGEAPVPGRLYDPAGTRTPEGAIAAYNGALVHFRTAFDWFVSETGLISDELTAASSINNTSAFGQADGLDARWMPEGVDAQTATGTYSLAYQNLQRLRGHASEALGLLRDFAPNTSPALRGQLFALTGYSELMLAELYCSGIPLSTLDYDGDYTLQPGSSTVDVLGHAVAMFDSALAISGDSARTLHLAHLGKARALLALGQVAAAAQLASEVPDGFRYAVSFNAPSDGASGDRNFAWISAVQPWAYSVGNREGGNGFDYRTSNDPRTRATLAGRNTSGGLLYHPVKYARDGGTPIVLADWIEARLIQAEAALAAGDESWLTTVNLLRQTAISPALTDLTDPGDPAARVDLLFRERAFWLFLTGHRQGDLRRLVRQYGRVPDAIYPTGVYGAGMQTYGTHVTAAIPNAERAANPKFTGCQNRDA